MASTWSPERIAELTRLRARGLSFGMIADELGISKDQAIGKANRLKLPKPQGVTVRRAFVLPQFRPGKPRLSNGVNRPHVPITAYTAAAGTTCKWPLEDFIARVRAHEEPFCGAPARPGSSWCDAHRRRVFVRA